MTLLRISQTGFQVTSGFFFLHCPFHTPNVNFSRKKEKKKVIQVISSLTENSGLYVQISDKRAGRGHDILGQGALQLLEQVFNLI